MVALAKETEGAMYRGVLTEVTDTKVAEFLCLIANIVVSNTECSCDSDMLNSSTNKNSNASRQCLHDEHRVRHLRRLNALGVELDDLKKIFFCWAAGIDGVGDAGKKNEAEEGTGDGDEPEDLVLFAPALADFFDDCKEYDAAETYGASVGIGVW